MSGDRCLVIGAGSPGGIGEAIWERLLLRQNGTQVSAPDSDHFDVTDNYMMEQYLQWAGPFNRIVYCAGVNRLQWIKGIDQQAFLEILAVNVVGFVNLLALHERLFPTATGSVVAVSSDAAVNPMRGSMMYCSSKAALDMAVRVAARELAPRWRVNAVAPAMIDGTAMSDYIDDIVPYFRGWTKEKAREYEKSNIPMGRRGTPDEVAQVIEATLFGPGFQTGSIVGITGGK